jgi:hypothetical protein
MKCDAGLTGNFWIAANLAAVPDGAMSLRGELVIAISNPPRANAICEIFFISKGKTFSIKSEFRWKPATD